MSPWPPNPTSLVRLSRRGRAEQSPWPRKLDASHHRERQYVVSSGIAEDFNNGWDLQRRPD